MQSFNLQLTICDTVGYGDQVNKEDSFKAVVDYIDAQFEAYLQEELKIKRALPTYHDSRLHVCLYFICPTGESKGALLSTVMSCYFDLGAYWLKSSAKDITQGQSTWQYSEVPPTFTQEVFLFCVWKQQQPYPRIRSLQFIVCWLPSIHTLY